MILKNKILKFFFLCAYVIVGTQEVHPASPVYIKDNMYLADPSAHVFKNRIYIYTSHDIVNDKPNANGDYYDMKDSRVISFNMNTATMTANKKSVDIADIPWAGRQLWAPDCAQKNNMYYLYYPVKDKNDIFKIGVAVSKKPTGPFKVQSQPIQGSYSIDPAVFEDTDGKYYLYFGGLSGGQLTNYKNNKLVSCASEPAYDSAAVCPKIAKLSSNMLEFAENPLDVKILDENGNPIKAGDKSRRFYEGAWVHKYNGKYYFSYSTGSTHLLCYAIGDTPYGPFIFKGILLTPVKGWTTHHSIINYQGKWYLFYHDSQLSGKSNLRNFKFRELQYQPDGSIITMDGLEN